MTFQQPLPERTRTRNRSFSCVAWLSAFAPLLLLSCSRTISVTATVDSWTSPPPGSKSFVLIDSNNYPRPMRLHDLGGATVSLTTSAALSRDVNVISGSDGSFRASARSSLFGNDLVTVSAGGCNTARQVFRDIGRSRYSLNAVLVCPNSPQRP